MIMTFGKYKGKQLDVVPLNYMEWMLKSGALEEVNTALKIEIYRVLCRHEIIDNDINEIIEQIKIQDKENAIRLQWKSVDETPIEDSIVNVSHLKRPLRFIGGEFYSNHGIKVSKEHIEKWAYKDTYHNRRLLKNTL